MVTVKNYAEKTGSGVLNALGTVSINPEMINYFTSRRDQWMTFGKMDSHLYRQQLFKAMEAKSLTGEAMMLVYAMASIIKNQSRIVQSMRDMPEEERFASSTVWMTVRSFFENDCVQYVSVAKRVKKMPVVNIPGTMPGLDILWFSLCTKDEERTVENLSKRPTFTQMNLASDAQTLAKEGYEFYWTQVVKGTRNSDNVEKPGMREEYYQTSAGDTYSLLSVDSSGTITEFEPNRSSVGYSIDEVRNYLRRFDV